MSVAFICLWFLLCDACWKSFIWRSSKALKKVKPTYRCEIIQTIRSRFSVTEAKRKGECKRPPCLPAREAFDGDDGSQDHSAVWLQGQALTISVHACTSRSEKWQNDKIISPPSDVWNFDTTKEVPFRKFHEFGKSPLYSNWWKN
jgi:hypothetical protein